MLLLDVMSNHLRGTFRQHRRHTLSLASNRWCSLGLLVCETIIKFEWPSQRVSIQVWDARFSLETGPDYIVQGFMRCKQLHFRIVRVAQIKKLHNQGL